MTYGTSAMEQVLCYLANMAEPDSQSYPAGNTRQNAARLTWAAFVQQMAFEK